MFPRIGTSLEEKQTIYHLCLSLFVFDSWMVPLCRSRVMCVWGSSRRRDPSKLRESNQHTSPLCVYTERREGCAISHFPNGTFRDQSSTSTCFLNRHTYVLHLTVRATATLQTYTLDLPPTTVHTHMTYRFGVKSSDFLTALTLGVPTVDTPQRSTGAKGVQRSCSSQGRREQSS